MRFQQIGYITAGIVGIAVAMCIAEVSISDASRAGKSCYKVTTSTATYYYDKTGGGFVSIVDKAGNDWISWQNASNVEYRGIPNLVHYSAGQGYFHPGNTGQWSCNTTKSGNTIISKSSSKSWECAWTFFDDHAELIVKRDKTDKPKNGATGTYWFLYEGTPGGGVDNSDYWLLSDGSKGAISNKIASSGSDIKGDDWVCYGEGSMNRVLFLIDHQNNSHPDFGEQWRGYFAKFAFGSKDGGDKYLDYDDGKFSIGIFESAEHSRIKAKMNALLGADPTSVRELTVVQPGQRSNRLQRLPCTANLLGRCFAGSRHSSSGGGVLLIRQPDGSLKKCVRY